jgi:hypothetical protein
MTKKLEELFDLPQSDPDHEPLVSDDVDVEAPVPATVDGLSVLDKINAALPAVNGLEASDKEMDQLAEMAVRTYQDLVDLGMNVESRFSSEIFSVASSLLGHAITAKNAKMNKKLKMIELQLRKAKLDMDRGDEVATAQGSILDRNELLEKLLQSQKDDSNNK